MSESLNTATPNTESRVQDNWQEVVAGLQELGVSQDPAERASQVAVMTGQGLTQFMTKVHEVVVPGEVHTPSDVARSIVGHDGTVAAELMQPAERQPLMDDAAGLIRQLAEKRTTPKDDIAFLKRAGNVAALAVVLTHHFVDGNGRTARTTAQLIREGIDLGNEESMSDMKILATNRPDGGFRVNSYVPTKAGLEATPGELLRIAAALDVPLQDQATYNALKQEAFTTPTPD